MIRRITSLVTILAAFGCAQKEDSSSPPSANVAGQVPSSIPSVTPLPGSNRTPGDADSGVVSGWPRLVSEAAEVGLIAVSGIITDVGSEGPFYFEALASKGFSIGIGQTFSFERDGAIAVDWVQGSWWKGQTELSAQNVASCMRGEGPVAVVDTSGQLVDDHDQTLRYEDDMWGSPAQLRKGAATLLFLSPGWAVRPGDEQFSTIPFLAGIFEIREGTIVQGDGSTVTLAEANSIISETYIRRQKHFEATPSNAASGE